MLRNGRSRGGCAAAGPQPSTLHFATTAPAEAGATRHWVAVATDGASGRPVQALTLACAR